MPSLIGAVIAGSGGVELTENYLRVRQSPGAALGGVGADPASAPLLTFSTPNLRLFSVLVEGFDLTSGPTVSNSDWSKAVRALQVTSELFAVFAPAVNAGDSTFCFMAPDFNTNAGASNPAGSAQAAVDAEGGNFSVVEQAIADALGTAVGNVSVNRVALTGLTVA